MTRTPELILHVGAPKCGSSALQTALSKNPDITDRCGRNYRYVTAWDPTRTRIPFPILRYGKALQDDVLFSRYGYAAFPALQETSFKDFCKIIKKIYKSGSHQNYTPILSNEGWITRHAFFSEILGAIGNPVIDVVAFLRPPLEWLNASFWQWGVWSTPDLTAWMNKSKMTYSFGEDLEAWSKIPNVRIRVRPSKPDIVHHFANIYELPLAAGLVSNTASPPVLIGFLLRNRRFRPDGHQAQTEFVFQRWCPKLNVRAPWAVGVIHVHRFRPIVAQNVETLRRILPQSDFDLLFGDPRWQDEKPYHSEILARVTPLHLVSELPMLLDSLRQGVAKAAAAAGASVPTLPDTPVTEEIGDWDIVLAQVMDQLLDMDAMARERAGKSIFRQTLWRRFKGGSF